MSEEVKTNQEPVEDQIQNQEPLEDNIEEPEMEEDESTEEYSEEPQDDTVPLKSHLEVKKKLREAKMRLEELEAKEYSEKIRIKRETVKNKWLSKGFDDDTASLMADEIAGVYEEIGAARQSHKESIVDEEIEELSEDDFYSDIKTYKKEIKNKINRFKKAGEDITVEEAYLMVVGPRTKYRDTSIRTKQKEILNNKKNGTASKLNVKTAASSNAKNLYPLDPVDKKALVGLKKAQPEANWTEKKYFEMYYGKK